MGLTCKIISQKYNTLLRGLSSSLGVSLPLLVPQYVPVQEFDMVDGSETPSANIEATRSDGPSVTPPSRNGTKPQNDFKTPSDFTSVFKTPGDDFKTPGSVFKTPSGDFTTPGSAFKTPKIHSHGVCKVRMIPTKSPMVTDV